jgi:hypothetical protein
MRFLPAYVSLLALTGVQASVAKPFNAPLSDLNIRSPADPDLAGPAAIPKRLPHPPQRKGKVPEVSGQNIGSKPILPHICPPSKDRCVRAYPKSQKHALKPREWSNEFTCKYLDPETGKYVCWKGLQPLLTCSSVEELKA